MDFLQRDDLPMIHDLREQEYPVPTTEEIFTAFGIDPSLPLGGGTLSLNQLIAAAETAKDEYNQQMQAAGAEKGASENPEAVTVPEQAPQTFTLGQMIDVMAQTTEEQGLRDKSYNFSTTVGQLLDLYGRDKAETYIKTMTANSNRKDFYEHSRTQVFSYWMPLCLFIAGFALLSVICLEFVDKDKR
jgi:hypothetical protein